MPIVRSPCTLLCPRTLVHDRIARVVPGFEDFNARVAELGGFRLPNPVNEGRYPTAGGKAVFTCNTPKMIAPLPGHLVLQSLRSHDQWNTIPYAMNDRYRGIHGSRRVVLVNPADLARPRSRRPSDGSERRAEGFRLVAYPAARGSAASYHPETNVLVPLDSVRRDQQHPDIQGRDRKAGAGHRVTRRASGTAAQIAANPGRRHRRTPGTLSRRGPDRDPGSAAALRPSPSARLVTTRPRRGALLAHQAPGAAFMQSHVGGRGC